MDSLLHYLAVEHDDTPDRVVEKVNAVLRKAQAGVKFVYNEPKSGDGTAYFLLQLDR